MNQQEKEIINIAWEGPFNIDEILKGEIDNNKYEVTSDDIGLYQIYGSHPLYGSDVLVYIGRTQDQKGFKSRLNNRWVINNGNDVNNVKIYLGKIFSDSKRLTDSEINSSIEKAEVLMIHALKPAFNSSNIQSVKDFNEDYIVYNRGSYRSLYPILDSNYFWKMYKNYEIVKRLAGDYVISLREEEDSSYGFIIYENDNYTIWIGIDYKIWNSKEHNCPLCLEVYKVFGNGTKSVKSLKDFQEFDEYDNGDSLSYLALDINITKEELDGKIQEVQKYLLK